MAAVIPYNAVKEYLEEVPNTTITQAAEAFGVTPSAIAQIIDSHNLKIGGSQGISAKHKFLDDEYDEVEKVVLTRLKQATSMLTDPMKLARVLQTVNSAKRRGGSHQQSEKEVSKNVTLVLPGAFSGKVVFNESQEVTEVGGRSLVTMPSQNVHQMLEKHKGEVKQEKEVTLLGDLL